MTKELQNSAGIAAALATLRHLTCVSVSPLLKMDSVTKS